MELKTIIVSAFIAFGVSALVSQISLRGATTAPPVVTQQAGAAVAAGPSYASLLASVDERIGGLKRRTDARADDWLGRGHLGTALFERASLTNQVEDFARVQAVLDDAFAIAPEGSGPLLLAARFNFAIHRLAEAEKYLDLVDRRAVPRGNEQVLSRTLRAEIAVQRGQYQAAVDALAALAAAAPEAANTELALYYAKTGKPDEAAALLATALATTRDNDPQRRAWIKLQLGILAMDRGELQAAQQHLQDAEAELAGWWLVHENIAEIHSRRDEHDKAIVIFEALVRTADLPQHMDALASLYRHKGAPEQAEALIERSAARWEQQLRRFPESAMGHALQHHLEFGTPERALELALANEALRPGGEAQVSLARAYLRAGQPTEALAVIERVLATPYRTARLHDIAAKVYTAVGDTAAAQAQLSLRLAVNPRFTSNDHSH